MEDKYQFMRFVSYSKLQNWSVQYTRAGGFGYSNKYPLGRIGSFLHRSGVVIEIANDIEYSQVTVRTNNGGVCLRGTKLGKEIGTKRQIKVSKGQYIVSKIDARNGAFGIIPDELDGAIVTNDFPVFDVDNSVILTEFLLLVTTTKQFIAFAQSCSSGTTNRRRIDIDKFLDQKIPLPSLKEQKALLDSYYNRLHSASQLNNKIESIEKKWKHHVWDLLFSQTTIETNVSSPRYIKLVHYKDLSNWGTFSTKNKTHKHNPKYKEIKLQSLCSVNSGGTPSRSKKEYYQGNIPWIKTGEVLNDIIYDSEEHITEAAVANSNARIYPKGSLIIAMYGQGGTRGRTAKLGIDATTNQACAVLHNIDNHIISTDYLWIYFQVMYDDLRSLASGSNQPNLNAGKIKNYDIVIPPPELQSAIVAYVNEAKSEILRLKEEAGGLNVMALQHFEASLFSNKG